MKLDEELAALLTPLRVSVEQPRAPIPIRVEFLGARIDYDLTVVQLYRNDETHCVSGRWHGTTWLVEADIVDDTRNEPAIEGMRLSPCTAEVERLLVKKRIPWCAYPERNIVLAALPRSEIVSLLLCLDHEYVLAARRRRYQEHRTSQELSKRLRQVLWQGEATKFLPFKDGIWFCGWLDGYCTILAEGLFAWVCASGEQIGKSLVPQLMLLAGEGKPVDHVVLRVGAWFLDGDGVSSRRTLLRRWQNQEGLIRPCLIAYDPRVVEKAGIPRDQERSCEIAACLTQVLGTFSPAWLAG